MRNFQGSTGDHSSSELKKEFLGATIEIPEIPSPCVTRISKYEVAVRAVARVLEFIEILKGKLQKVIVDVLTLDHKGGESLLIKKAQWDSYPNEMELLRKGLDVPKSSNIFKLSPVLKANGEMVMHSRLTNVKDEQVRQPVILYEKHPLTKLIIDYFHRLALHQGHDTVRNNIRQRFWITGLRTAVRRCFNECRTCKLRRAMPKPPMMGALPAVRVEPQSRPFTIVGLDYFGPMEVTVGRRREKRYGVIFICMTTRAIHIEVAHSLTTDSCIMAILRFTARRGQPLELMSDNGTNMRGADKELKQGLDELDQKALTETLGAKGIKWTFIPPSSPHMGGSWERLIRSVKTALNVIMKSRYPKDEVLSTLLLEVEVVVNSRPLTEVPVDPNDPEALTPLHFLLGTSNNRQPQGAFDDRDLLLTKRWRTAQRLADMFWSRWRKEYLPTLQRRKKWHGKEPNSEVGDVVLVHDESLRRGHWPLGIIVNTFPGKDGVTRVIQVKTSSGTYRRPVVKVAKLDLQVQDGFRPEIGGKDVPA